MTDPSDDFSERMFALFFPKATEDRTRAEQLAAIPGQVECGRVHDILSVRERVAPCPGCRATV